MEPKKMKAVFFDCWSTLITFHTEDEWWETRALINHLTNKEDVSVEEIASYGHSLLKKYYDAHLEFEITAEQFITLLVLRYHLKLDCSIQQVVKEILHSLDPAPIKGISSFLTVLEENHIPYACLSNTIYPQAETEGLIKKLIPNHCFAFVLTSQEVGVKKPNPAFFDLGPLLLGVKKEESCYIGDSYLQDICGSYQDGYGLSIWLNEKKKTMEDLRFVASFYQGYEKVPHWEVTSYEELIQKGESFGWKKN